ncbi:CDP-glycerol glycerophosphotransferase family protein [Streptomyces uncialis]|uniref:bifunctional glycosyltransferase/CDP-glycerol:glycerophosphate glycerophosphotransferase n=1 Tax=Streptomyces uncialis TaxID=1048205 RepID=UPI0037A6B5C9
MPRFSVVVPVYRIQGYLRECLESVLGQTPPPDGTPDPAPVTPTPDAPAAPTPDPSTPGDRTPDRPTLIRHAPHHLAAPAALTVDRPTPSRPPTRPPTLELIVVDDASPDASAAIAAEYAARDPRVRLIRLDRHTGAGAARNAGAARARGEYLFFLDGDDLLLPGALTALDRALTHAGDPEVLLFGHDTIDWWETVRPVDEDLTGDPLALAPVAWNRVVRREFWHAHALGFTDEAPYEDVIPAHRAVLLAGERATVLDRVCVRWRERRGGSVSTTPGPAHLAFLARYDTLLGGLAPDERARVFPYLTPRALAVLTDPGRIRSADRRDFFRETARLHRAHAPAGHVPRTAEERAVAAGSSLAYDKLRKAGTRRRRLAAGLNRGRAGLRGRLMRAAYRADLRRGLDPRLAVYSAYWNRGVSCNPAAVYAKARELAPHIRGVWVVAAEHRHHVPDGVEYVVEGTRRYWRTMARATYLVSNSGFPGGFTKRPGQTYLQTHHGTPLKRMGLDQRRYPAGTHGISFSAVLAHADQWDLSLSANPHSTEVWERGYPSTAYRALELGYPRNDVYFRTGPDEVGRLRAALGVPPGRTALLYAPTHRDHQPGFLPRLDLERLVRALGPRYVVLVRAHYRCGPGAEVPRHPRVLDVTAHHRVEELCLAADALITDYSSLMFDYACLDRPIITYAPDWQAYRLARGTYFDLLSGRPGDTPGAVATVEDELIELFRSGRWDTPATDRLRAAFRTRFCPYDDGHAAERVVRELMLT